MSHLLLILTFGAACLGASVCACRSGSGSAVLLGLLLSTVWVGATALAQMGAASGLPLLDLPVACAAYAMWFEGRQPWQGWALLLFVSRLPLHALYSAGGVEWVAYLHWINALFIGSLVAVAWKGGISDAIGFVSDRFGSIPLVRRFRVAGCPRATVSLASR